MRKYMALICVGIMAVAFVVSGCSDSSSTENESQTTEETTGETTEYATSDEDSIKPEIDYKYAAKLIGYWVYEKQSITFEKGDVFYMVDEEGGESKGEYSVVASPDGVMAISLAINENNIKVYTAELKKSDKKLVITDEVGNVTEYIKTNPEEE